eukprot:scaffold754_cov130-Isochrysis_galbana.AAC.2
MVVERVGKEELSLFVECGEGGTTLLCCVLLMWVRGWLQACSAASLSLGSSVLRRAPFAVCPQFVCFRVCVLPLASALTHGLLTRDAASVLMSVLMH